MKKFQLIAILILFASLQAFSQTSWTIDKSHTHILFSVKHMIISDVTGYFRIFDGKVTATDDFNNLNVDFEIDVASVNTDNEMRDKHLRSGDFFETEKFPKITFKSKSFKKVEGNNYKLTGDLTLKGVTKTFTFDVEYNGTIKDPYGNTRAGFQLTGKVNRFDYNIGWNKTIETGGLIVGKDVKIDCQIEIFKK